MEKKGLMWPTLKTFAYNGLLLLLFLCTAHCDKQ